MVTSWKPYVPVAERRRKVEKQMEKRTRKGHAVAPVVLEGRVIAKTFWGRSWCDNLERYSDYANRLPRGRSYVRNGSVVDLQITHGVISAWVSGSELYKVEVKITTLATAHWKQLVDDCAGEIDSVVELLQGKLSQAVMQRMCKQDTGLFPTPKEIDFECSCPDWAFLCKHIAAVLYGIGARLDERPELLFALRAVDHAELLTSAGQQLRVAKKKPASARLLDERDLSRVFGIEIAGSLPSGRKPKTASPGARQRRVGRK